MTAGSPSHFDILKLDFSGQGRVLPRGDAHRQARTTFNHRQRQKHARSEIYPRNHSFWRSNNNLDASQLVFITGQGQTTQKSRWPPQWPQIITRCSQTCNPKLSDQQERVSTTVANQIHHRRCSKHLITKFYWFPNLSKLCVVKELYLSSVIEILLL